MNDADIKFLRLKIQADVHATVLHGLIAAMTQMPGGQRIRQTLQSALRDSTNKLVFPGLDPAMSDMYAGEYQDAVTRFLAMMASD